MPDYTGDITGLGTVRLLEAIRRSGVQCRLYQASSSEMFGDAPAPQHEWTPFQPRSPYAAALVGFSTCGTSMVSISAAACSLMYLSISSGCSV